MSDYHYKIMQARKDESKFYAKLGKFFASKEIRKELGGYPMSNEPDWAWVVAQEKRGLGIVGFISMEPAGDGLILHDLYVVAEHRGHGVGSTLLKKALHFAEHEGLSIRATVPQKTRMLFQRAGFAVKSERGSWQIMKKERAEL